MFRKTACLIFFFLLVSGCAMTTVQREQVARFGKATEAIGAFAEKELPEVHREIIEMKTMTLVLSTDDNNPNIDLDKPTSAVDTAKRLAAARALKSYGSLLNGLATADRTESIKEKAQELVDTCDSALKQDLSDEQKKAAIGLITSLGKMWLEKRKKDAVKAIVMSYSEPVEELATLFLGDFTADGEGYLGGYTAVAGKLENKAILFLSSEKYQALEDRELAVNAFVTAKAAKIRAKEMEVVARKAISDLSKANGKLAEVMRQGKYTAKEIKAYAQSIQELVNMAKVSRDN